ncbi:helix-turn-helix domain-containing protein [Caballeronia sp. 15715]|uniref:helix-turn-helix domain-containing protein n=1 Tax=Caballeronia sp. 15715 TaxID=3391030 RepID=UPI0039E44F96
MKSLRESFAVAVKRRRLNLGVSQEELALRTSLDRTGISRLERVAPNITLDTADSVSRALDSSVPELLGEQVSKEHKLAASRDVFAARVREERVAHSLTQEEVGDRAGVDRNYVSDVERGKKNCRLDTVDAFGRGLGVRPLVLLKFDIEINE